jgi:hypothetical protein
MEKMLSFEDRLLPGPIDVRALSIDHREHIFLHGVINQERLIEIKFLDVYDPHGPPIE